MTNWLFMMMMIWGCNGLNESVSHALKYLNTWSPVRGEPVEVMKWCGLAGGSTTFGAGLESS